MANDGSLEGQSRMWMIQWVIQWVIRWGFMNLLLDDIQWRSNGARQMLSSVL